MDNQYFFRKTAQTYPAHIPKAAGYPPAAACVTAAPAQVSKKLHPAAALSSFCAWFPAA